MGVSFTLRPLYCRRKSLSSHCSENGNEVKNLCSYQVSNPDLVTHSQSPYLLKYPRRVSYYQCTRTEECGWRFRKKCYFCVLYIFPHYWATTAQPARAAERALITWWKRWYFPLTTRIKPCGSVVATSAYSECEWFESWPEDRFPCLRFSVGYGVWLCYVILLVIWVRYAYIFKLCVVSDVPKQEKCTVQHFLRVLYININTCVPAYFFVCFYTFPYHFHLFRPNSAWW
jgi:hypothetical protein